MPSRPAIPKSVETDVLVACSRRCCLCFYLDGFDGVKKGQIAHVNQRSGDHRAENLVWLCLEHHDAFDSTTSQSKNFTQEEVRSYRDNLIRHLADVSTASPVGSAGIPASSDPERRWRQPPWSTADRPALFPFRSRNRIDGVCVIERLPLADGRMVVACVSVPGNPGNSITNTVETICEQVCRQFEIEPEDVVWLENYDYINPGEWLQVTFGKMPPDVWGDPEWKKVDEATWQDLGLRPVLRLRSSHGELISKLRRVRAR